MKIVVTGGTGYLGHHLCKALANAGYNVISVDNYTRGNLNNHIDGVEYIASDTQNIDFALKDKPDIIYHLGEYSRVSTSFKDINLCHESNMVGTFKVLQYCIKHKVRLIYGASSSLFSLDGKNDSPYAFFKGTNVELIKNYNKWFDLQYDMAYFFNTYGDQPVLTKYDSVINNFVNNYLDKQPLSIVRPGTQTRCYTHVSDIIAGLVLLLKNSATNQEYHFGGNKMYNTFDIASLFPDANYVLLPPREGERLVGAMPDTTTTEKLGWLPKVELDEWVKKKIKL